MAIRSFVLTGIVAALLASAAAASIGLPLAAPGASADPAARAAIPSELPALRQAVFDYYFTNNALAAATITRIRVLPIGPSPLRSRIVTKYASIAVKAKDATGQDIGYEAAIAVYYSSPAAGWHVYDDGTSDVGCDRKWYPVGRMLEILKRLGMSCP